MVMMVMARDHCKLELWDDDDGIDNRQPPDIVIDNTVLIKQDQKWSIDAISCPRCQCQNDADIIMIKNVNVNTQNILMLMSS